MKARARPPLDVSRRASALMAVLAAKPGAVANAMPAPKGRDTGVLIYKVMGKMFAIVSLRNDESVILKCDPNLAHALRRQYKGVGHRSHLDKRFWICVTLDADVPAKEVRRLVEHSYDLVCSGLTRKQKAELAALQTAS
jgi:predicted DNA-binding protein (MmcQ/YjbR family)